MMGKVLAIIPARSGSKGIPNKNSRLLAGQPLITYTIEAARASGVVDRLILSTDSPKIADLARALGMEVPFIRPAALARDDTPMLPVLQHAVSEVEEEGYVAEIVILLQPTAPLRRPKHLMEAVSQMRSAACDSVVSVVAIPRHYSPQYAMKIVDGRLTHYLEEGKEITRRQDVLPAYSRDGTLYAVRRNTLMKENSLYGRVCHPMVIPREESVNLDTLDDWALAEKVLTGDC